MKTTIAAAAGPAFLAAAPPANAYNLEEIERKLRSGKSIDGVYKRDLPTPALLVDLDALDANIRKMAEHAKANGVDLRPHAKTHKTPHIAQRQVAAGALGNCCATIREAEILAAAGIPGLLITSELTGPNKVARLMRLVKKHPDTMAAVDHIWQAEQFSEAAQAAKIDLGVMIDIDPIGRRTGVEPGEKAVELAKQAAKLPRIKVRGVHGYSGASSHVTGFADRRVHSEKVMTPVIDSFRAMQKAGLPAEIMSGASTGTYNIDTDFDGMTELQVGSYVFMDVDYRRIGGQSGEVYEDFKPSLTVLATVVSRNHSDIATIDAGLKAFATDRSFGPDVIGIPGATYGFNGDEHGRLNLKDAARDVKLGEKVELIVPHCDPNVNLYDMMYVCRGDKVVEVWPVAARGQV